MNREDLQPLSPLRAIKGDSYAAYTVTVADPAGKTQTFTMDALGNLTQVQEPDPSLGTVTTSYAYDILNHLIQVSMPRGSNTQTRTFNYLTGTTVGIDLLSATNPENGTVTYTYNSDHTLHTKTDAKNQVFTYLYDSYKRLTSISVGSTVLRTFMYDTNTLDSNFSGLYTAGRLVAVQHTAFTPQGYVSGQGGSNITVPSSMQFTEMYNYTQPGLTAKKRLQVEETAHYYVNGIAHDDPKTLNLDGVYTYDNEGKMTSVNYPTTYSWNGSQLVASAGPTYTYSFDAMDRPTGLKDQNNATAVSNVSYNPANQLLSISYFGTNESRQYNNLNQMTSLTVGSDTIAYTFPTNGTNNGKISSQTDSVSGETVTYQYDSLNRLLSASSNQSWSETYGYDGFGNLVSKTPTGGAPTLSQAVNAATNQIVGQSYDANGNQTSGGYSYDAENRLATSTGLQYAYDSRNKRVWKSVLSGGNLTQEVYFYGVDGQKLGTYGFSLMLSPGSVMTDSASSLAVFFGGKRVGITSGGTTTAFKQNRLGSNQGFQFYPYGEARGTAPADTVGFATYTRDSATGLDYADQRYYASNFGRFMSPDPYMANNGAAGDPADSGSWNHYDYTRGDPINRIDSQGLYDDEGPPPAGCFVNGTMWYPICPSSPHSSAYVPLDPLYTWRTAADFNSHFRYEAKKAIKGLSPNCQKVLGNLWNLYNGDTSLLAKAGTDIFMDGSVIASRNLSQYGIPGGGTVGDALTDNAAFVSQYGGKASNQIILGIGGGFDDVPPELIFNFSVSRLASPPSIDQWQNAVLVHEVLHTYTGMNDADLAKTLTGYTGSYPSTNIALFLLRDCNK